ncbi:aminotransferase class III-fold pyridoxal phosphate-dependent enzyme [Pseudoduganella sp. FT25W]|uniref:Aminotransferase class III-fold pyridoxal phosphate-dependent enzyme n=1 Tax=Duganella alba TaxID=2666081 RepID=A0A6L5QGU5_9BURK|nr:aspartate aminotransferase family protein [Duganella alba]MRX08512.1 aminotransferase class III-fold pyridoxal phosphate-dependent enzyme [Duganella alba]MRX17014.1 aminotransferase class III-fold pyridoxal phosphate-dependent enzyme [Duganella alba]
MSTRDGLDWQRVQALIAAERADYAARNPESARLAGQAAQHLLFGVPMHWMNDWSTPFPLTVREASGARFRDADGHEYVDFCLGDTGAMFGHAPQPVAQAIARQSARGYTAMLPSEDAGPVAAELARRFGLPYWQFALSASDANRFVLRWLRAATGRSRVLVFNGCYHGTVDDVFVDLVNGVPAQRDSLLGQVHKLTDHTVVVEFNDLPALEAALAQGDIACVLAEPVMTNVGMVLPQQGYWEAAQQLIKQHGALLVIDETHTISSGPGGYARAHGMQPDALVVGKPVGGGIPCAVYGFTEELARRVEHAKRSAPPGHSGIGTTLSANMFAMAAMRANLEQVMTELAYQHMFALASQLADGLRDIIARHRLPWCVTQVGARTEFQFAATPPRNGSEAQAIMDGELEQAIHLYLLNRGLLITPFHNMLLVCPATTADDVARLLSAFSSFLADTIQIQI